MDEPAAEACERLVVTLHGETHLLGCAPGETIVQAAFRAGIVPPVSCLAGQCGTCMARITEGRVAMLANDVLTPDEIAQGYALTCQAVPTTRGVALVYED